MTNGPNQDKPLNTVAGDLHGDSVDVEGKQTPTLLSMRPRPARDDVRS